MHAVGQIFANFFWKIVVFPRRECLDEPRTRNNFDKKNFGFWTKFGDFVKIWNLVKFEILNPKISKFEILNPNTQNVNLDNKNLIFWWILNKLEENFNEIGKFGDNSKFDQNPKFESLTLKSKIWNH